MPENVNLGLAQIVRPNSLNTISNFKSIQLRRGTTNFSDVTEGESATSSKTGRAERGLNVQTEQPHPLRYACGAIMLSASASSSSVRNCHNCSYSCTCHVLQTCARNCARSPSRPKLRTELLTTHIDIRVVRTVRSHLESTAAPHTTGCPFLKWITGTDAVRPQAHYQLHQLNSKNKIDEQSKMNFSQQIFITNGRWGWGLFLEGLQHAT